MVVIATATLAGGGVYLALSGDDDEDPSPGTDPASTSVPVTFAVDLSTGDDDATNVTAIVPTPTLPLPAISLPLPGVTLPPPTTVD
jgi:hypothetical protein